MNQLNTQAIILTRTNYGEADRILTLITPEHGKLTLMARGVRRVKSKLAGGVELFSVSNISFIRGRGEIGTLISTRLVQHYGRIVSDIGRTMLGYDLIKQLHRITEDQPEHEYFDLLVQLFTALDEPDLSLDIVRLWFAMQLVKLGGHAPNVRTSALGQALVAVGRYNFDVDAMTFVPHTSGRYQANNVKLLRLALSVSSPLKLANVQVSGDVLSSSEALAQIMLRTHLRI